MLLVGKQDGTEVNREQKIAKLLKPTLLQITEPCLRNEGRPHGVLLRRRQRK